MQKIPRIAKRWFYEKPMSFLLRLKEPVRVLSHPRSGTHFGLAFLGRNFYSSRNFSVTNGHWGHWSDQQPVVEPIPNGRLFYSHQFPSSDAFKKARNRPLIFMIRDGRSVAYSLWRSSHFKHKDDYDISFADYLRKPLDWIGSPGLQASPDLRIMDHWRLHTKGWLAYANSSSMCLVVRFEDLLNDPYGEYLRIRSKFFAMHERMDESEIDTVMMPVGLSTNDARNGMWRNLSDFDVEQVFSKYSGRSFGYW